MYNDDRRNVTPVVPTGLEKVGTELESVHWIHSQLQKLDRLPVCKRRDSLKTILTEMLEATSVESHSALLQALKASENKLQLQSTQHAKEIAELRKELDESLSHHHSSEFSASRQQPKGRSWFSYLITFLLGFICAVTLIARNYTINPILREPTIPERQDVPALKP